MSPDGRWLAYGERAASRESSGDDVAGWQSLKVVRSNGTGTRTVLELGMAAPDNSRTAPVLQLPRPGKDKRPWTGDLIWSADGQHLAFAVTEWTPDPAGVGNCTYASIYSVEVASGRARELLRSPRPGPVRLLGWWPDRKEVALFADECGHRPAPDVIRDDGIHGHVVIAKVNGGPLLQQRALAPSQSPDGQWLFVSSFVEPASVVLSPGPAGGGSLIRPGGGPRLTSPILFRHLPTGELEPTLKLAGAFRANLRWVNAGAIAIIETLPHVPFGQPPIADEVVNSTHEFLRLDSSTGTVRTLRKEATDLTLVDASPDGAHMLVGIAPARATATSPAYELYRVRVSDLEKNLPPGVLRLRGQRLRGDQGYVAAWGYPEYVGWIR
ncbi:hypothetical protein [Myxococcus vastator]|uniref:hypothetical protein n=1 Tax=Myxococcus vastator TaxID=2709664 RepID=UPI0013D60C4C|nr:hypothetical protein [Myxococcus vastator]